MVDPIRQTRGFFQWRDGGLDQVGGFYLTADRGDRIALARLVNDLENIPNADGGRRGPLPPPGGRADRHAHPTRTTHVDGRRPGPVRRRCSACSASMLGVLGPGRPCSG